MYWPKRSKKVFRLPKTLFTWLPWHGAGCRDYWFYINTFLTFKLSFYLYIIEWICCLKGVVHVQTTTLFVHTFQILRPQWQGISFYTLLLWSKRFKCLISLTKITRYIFLYPVVIKEVEMYRMNNWYFSMCTRPMKVKLGHQLSHYLWGTPALSVICEAYIL